MQGLLTVNPMECNAHISHVLNKCLSISRKGDSLNIVLNISFISVFSFAYIFIQSCITVYVKEWKIKAP